MTFALTLTLVVVVDRSSSPSSVGTSGPDFAAARRSTDGLISAVRAAIAADPRKADGYTRLGNAYLQKVRESADSSYYPRIEAAFKRALALKPGDAGALASALSVSLADPAPPAIGDEFSWDAIARRHVDLYSELLAP